MDLPDSMARGLTIGRKNRGRRPMPPAPRTKLSANLLVLIRYASLRPRSWSAGRDKRRAGVSQVLTQREANRKAARSLCYDALHCFVEVDLCPLVCVSSESGVKSIL